MLVEFCKWGNSLAVRIPKTVAEALKVGVGRHAEIAIAFNELTRRCVACPITRRDRDWSFHVAITGIDDVQGVVQTDQLRSVSWDKRGSRLICSAPATVLDEVRAKLTPLLSL